MVWPIPGREITSAYGIKGQHWKACGWHTGADIAAPKGTPILAPIAGTIRHRSYGSAFGPNQFVISPSKGQPFADEEFFVAHTLDRLKDGTEVKAGQHIARVGDLGNATGPHGHFERHKGKGAWSCGVMLNPQAMFDWQPASAPPPASGKWIFPSGHKVYAKYLKVNGHEQNPDRESDSIKALQEMLNKHKMPGGTNLPVTGKYWTQTDTEVRLCQRLHIPPADAAMKSYVGPKQFAHLKSAVGAPYIWVP